jgi:multidrug efflux system membrane fusion protein
MRAPIDGRVGQLLLHEGNVVKQNETTLAVINQVAPIYVTFSVPEQNLPAIRQRAASAQLAVAALVSRDRGEPALGTLSFINNTVDTATGTVLLKAEYPNTDEKLWPGQFVDVALTLSVHERAVVIPAEAIQQGQQGQFVFVVGADMTAAPRPVVVGDTVAGEVVVKDGVQAGERIVTDGQIRLAPGSPVQIKEPSPAAQAHAAASK